MSKLEERGLTDYHLILLMPSCNYFRLMSSSVKCCCLEVITQVLQICGKMNRAAAKALLLTVLRLMNYKKKQQQPQDIILLKLCSVALFQMYLDILCKCMFLIVDVLFFAFTILK